MSGWIIYANEFESAIVLISAPVALLVALWGMTANKNTAEESRGL